MHNGRTSQDQSMIRQIILNYSYSRAPMGYTVADLTSTKNYVIANGVALLLTFVVNYSSQIIAMACYESDSKQQGLILERILETSRTLYWFGIATAFSVFPPFYSGIHCAILGWFTLVLVVLAHIFCFVRRCDQERSLWAYWYYFYHASIFTWIVVALIMGYHQSEKQPQATGINQY